MLQKNCGIEEWSVIDILKYKLKDVHVEVDESALQLKDFKVLGNPGKEILTTLGTKPIIKEKLRLQMRRKPQLKPVLIRTPIATRPKKRLNYGQ